MSRSNNWKLVVFVGFPRSGKTTKAKELSKKLSAPIVNPDSVRLAIHGQDYIQDAENFVWATTKAMVKSLFLAGHDTVIIDACNNTRKRRDEWRYGPWELVFEVVNTTMETCRERAAAPLHKYEGVLTEEALRAKRHAAKLVEAIERMHDQHEPVSEDEGFVRIVGPV